MTLSQLLKLAPADPAAYSAARHGTRSDTWTAPGAPPTNERVVFGGLVVAQAIVAASVETRPLHSLHAFFIGGGEKERTFDIHVERSRDGGSFATRHVEIRQGERLLLAAYTSHHDGDKGPEHQVAMPDITPPEKLEDFSVLRKRRDEQAGRPVRNYIADQLLDVRHADQPAATPGAASSMAVWFRSRETLADMQTNQPLHQAVVAFASDVPMVFVGLKDHVRAPGVALQTASLDHSIWFHRQAQADDWMLYTLASPIVRNGRGLSHGSIFNRRGELVASVAQEFLARTSRSTPS